MQMSYLSLCHVYNRLLVWFFAGFRINARATVESVRLALFRFGRCPLTSSIDERTLRSTTTCLAVLSSRLVATWTPSSSLITSWRTISAGTTPPPRRRSRLHSMRHGLLKIGVLSTCSRTGCHPSWRSTLTSISLLMLKPSIGFSLLFPLRTWTTLIHGKAQFADLKEFLNASCQIFVPSRLRPSLEKSTDFTHV